MKHIDWSVPQYCADCGELMRPKGNRADFPQATVQAKGHGLCTHCYSRHEYRGDLQDWRDLDAQPVTDEGPHLFESDRQREDLFAVHDILRAHGVVCAEPACADCPARRACRAYGLRWETPHTKGRLANASSSYTSERLGGLTLVDRIAIVRKVEAA